MLRDLLNNLDFKRGISPAAAVTDNTAFVSQILDMQGLSGAVFVILNGSLADADATFTVLPEEGEVSNLSDNTTVAAGDLLGTAALAGFTFAADDKVLKIGFRNSGKRYKRVTITPANNTGNAFVNGVWVTSPLLAPSANPPT